jgi:hypothetical protein
VSAICASPADSGALVFGKVPLDKVRALQTHAVPDGQGRSRATVHALGDKVLRRDVLWRACGPLSLNGTVVAPRANKPWREKPNAGGERRR